MSAEIKKFNRPIQSSEEAFWRDLASDPRRMSYWKEIAILWNNAAPSKRPRLRVVGGN